MSLIHISRHLLSPLFRFLQHIVLIPFFLLPVPLPLHPMEDRKNDPNPKPHPAPATAHEEEAEAEAEAEEDEEQVQVEVVSADEEEGEEDEQQEEKGEEEEEEEDDDHEDDEEEFVEGDVEDEGEEEEEGEDDDEEFEYVSEFVPRNPRTPFTSLSQVDADLALARTLQEQERAYMMLRMGGGGGVRDFAGAEIGSDYVLNYDDGRDEDNQIGEVSSVDESYHDEGSSAFDDDEAYARVLQNAEEREVAVRFMALAGINDWVAEDVREHANSIQDIWSEVDPDELSYEELVALGEAVGTESRGLAADMIASLPSVSYKIQNAQEGSNDQCVICRLDYEDGDSLVVLSCKHMYHPECISRWLQINKVCPICSAEVSTSDK